MKKPFLALLFVFVLPVHLAFSAEQPNDVLFQIGRADASPAEFQGHIRWTSFLEQDHPVVLRYVVGQHKQRDWPEQHVSTRDFRNAGKAFTLEIEFHAKKNYDGPLYLVVGVAFAHPTEPSLICVKTNGVASEPKRQPMIARLPWSDDEDPRIGEFESVLLEIPPNTVQTGQNVLSITLEDGSWMYYDYLVLREKPEPLERHLPPDLVREFREGPMNNVREILFVVRKPGEDEHWYANFGYYAADENKFPFPLGTGGKMCILNLDTNEVRTIFEDAAGSIRDPQIHYDAQKVLFSYLPNGKRHYNLYEINLDGTGLRQLTFGDWDDVESTYLPNGDIIFVSTRSKRWVQCWLTQVATLHRCGPNGEDIRELSANVEQDNTPWVLPNGQILYMRWEYVDRSQVDYHHLWTMNPDGTRQMVYYGNYHPAIVMLGAKPIPNSDKVVAIFSPGHGRTEHYGQLVVLDPRAGPDNPASTRRITQHSSHADPWAFSEDAFLVARQSRLELVNGEGDEQMLYSLPSEERSAKYWVHEPRPILVREREQLIADQTDSGVGTGRLALVNIYEGRRMQDVTPGSIKELLVLETLPEPVHYSGGMDQISAGGTFTLERIVGTVPVSPDGSAYMELPALRSFFFVALDHEGKPVKRMHSFTSVMPGETTTCIGCHEQRTQTPNRRADAAIMRLLHKAPNRPKPVSGVPDVFDFPRDIQPILDRHCVSCHSEERRDAGISLSGDWGPMYSISYLTLSVHNLFGDNRNRAMSDFKPYEIGSSSSRLLRLVDEKHQGVELSTDERKVIQYWLEVGANYAGTYAANGTGLIGWYYRNQPIRDDLSWSETAALGEAVVRRCSECHTQNGTLLLPRSISQDGAAYDRHWMFNLSYPEKSRLLQSPLAQNAGGSGRCEQVSGKLVFANGDDPDYQTILAGIQRGRDYILNESNRFSMKPFVANGPYTREMKRYGVLPIEHDLKSPIDPYETDRKYWESLWYVPKQ